MTTTTTTPAGFDARLDRVVESLTARGLEPDISGFTPAGTPELATTVQSPRIAAESRLVELEADFREAWQCEETSSRTDRVRTVQRLNADRLRAMSLETGEGGKSLDHDGHLGDWARTVFGVLELGRTVTARRDADLYQLVTHGRLTRSLAARIPSETLGALMHGAGMVADRPESYFDTGARFADAPTLTRLSDAPEVDPELTDRLAELRAAIDETAAIVALEVQRFAMPAGTTTTTTTAAESPAAEIPVQRVAESTPVEHDGRRVWTHTCEACGETFTSRRKRTKRTTCYRPECLEARTAA